MDPTIAEQLAGLKRVIKDVVRPAVSSDYAESVLYFSVRLLNSLAIEADAAHPANVREIARLAQLFRELLPELRREAREPSIGGAVLKELEEFSEATLADPSDVHAAQRLVLCMREVAAQVIRLVAFSPEAAACTTAISRYVADLRDLQRELFKVGN
jgi:hypothetical protein